MSFILTIGMFTYRIVKGSRRKWTRRGLAFFIVASVAANGYYYEVWPLVFAFVFPVFAMLALPLALALFAEEFGALEKNIERRERRAERDDSLADSPKPAGDSQKRFTCEVCGRKCETQNGLNAHMRAHKRKEQP